MMNRTDQVIDKTGWNYTVTENEIIETELLDIYEKMLYITLKRFANIQTGEAFPGVKKVAKFAGMSERKARDVISSLAKKKFIGVERRTNQTNIYTLFSTPAHGAVGHAHGAGGVVHAVHEGGAPCADELKKLELKKDELKILNDTLSVSKNENTIPYEKIIGYLNQRCDTKFRATTQKTKALIKARWNEGFKLDDFKRVIDNKSNQWLGNQDMQKYLRPETLFGTKFEGYLNELTTTVKRYVPVTNHPEGIDW